MNGRCFGGGFPPGQGLRNGFFKLFLTWEALQPRFWDTLSPQTRIIILDSHEKPFVLTTATLNTTTTRGFVMLLPRHRHRLRHLAAGSSSRPPVCSSSWHRAEPPRPPVRRLRPPWLFVRAQAPPTLTRRRTSWPHSLPSRELCTRTLPSLLQVNSRFSCFAPTWFHQPQFEVVGHGRPSTERLSSLWNVVRAQFNTQHNSKTPDLACACLAQMKRERSVPKKDEV